MSMDGKKRVLVADDEERNRKLIGVILERNGHTVDMARDGVEALAMAAAGDYDLILLDVMMPTLDGYEVCKRLKADAATAKVPVVMVTSLSDRDSRLRGLEVGADDFLTKPLDSTELVLRCANLLKVKEYEDFLARHNALLAREVEAKAGELMLSYRETIMRLTKMSEFKDEETGAHIGRVSLYCVEIAQALGWPEEEVALIELASPMHDIGKVGIPSEILLKRGRLTEVEYSLMKTHAELGAQILAGSSLKLIQMSERIARYHHERWDGTGYPLGLAGEAIPVEARIVNLADQYDALRSARPYKHAFDHEKATSIITEGDGRTMPGHFDPAILQIFREKHERFQELFDANNG